MAIEVRRERDFDSAKEAAGGLRQLVEALIEAASAEEYSAAAIGEAASRLADEVIEVFNRRNQCQVYEQALERAPWLQSEASRLQRQREELRQSLQALCWKVEKSQAVDRWLIIDQVTDLAERLIEHDLAESNLLHTAYPVCNWTEEESERDLSS